MLVKSLSTRKLYIQIIIIYINVSSEFISEGSYLKKINFEINV